MGLFGGTKVDDVEKFKRYLFEGEEIEGVYKLILDAVCFTNKRVIYFDNKLVSKKKKRVVIPYSSIKEYAIEDAGRLDRDADVVLFCHGKEFSLEFKKGTDMDEIDKILAKHICK